MQDTTLDPVIAARRPKPYPNYQLSEDYYRAGQLIWLEADVLIRSGTGNRKSLDEFARAFSEYSDDAMKAAVKAVKAGNAPVRLLLKEFNRYRTVSIDYRDRLRYPALERIEGKPDYLTPILNARK